MLNLLDTLGMRAEGFDVWEEPLVTLRCPS
jgi:hypothetical protein